MIVAAEAAPTRFPVVALIVMVALVVEYGEVLTLRLAVTVTSKGIIYGAGSLDNQTSEEQDDIYFDGKFSATKGISLHGQTSNPDDKPFSITMTRR